MYHLFEFGIQNMESYLLHHRIKVLEETFVIKAICDQAYCDQDYFLNYIPRKWLKIINNNCLYHIDYLKNKLVASLFYCPTIKHLFPMLFGNNISKITIKC